MKKKEKRNALNEEVEALNKEPAELSDDELDTVTGGIRMRVQILVFDKANYDLQGEN